MSKILKRNNLTQRSSDMEGWGFLMALLCHAYQMQNSILNHLHNIHVTGFPYETITIQPFLFFFFGVDGHDSWCDGMSQWLLHLLLSDCVWPQSPFLGNILYTCINAIVSWLVNNCDLQHWFKNLILWRLGDGLRTLNTLIQVTGYPNYRVRINVLMIYDWKIDT